MEAVKTKKKPPFENMIGKGEKKKRIPGNDT